MGKNDTGIILKMPTLSTEKVSEFLEAFTSPISTMVEEQPREFLRVMMSRPTGEGLKVIFKQSFRPRTELGKGWTCGYRTLYINEIWVNLDRSNNIQPVDFGCKSWMEILEYVSKRLARPAGTFTLNFVQC